MGRPSFRLSDDQARILLQGLAPIQEQFPPDPRDHRPFVRAFLRIVHTATGQTFSPAIYRRLLDAYAPDRKPSTDTLAQEKKALDEALDQEARAGRQLEAGAGDDLSAVVRREISDALATINPTRVKETRPDALLTAQFDFLQQRLVESERATNDARLQAARLAGELEAACAVRDALQAQLADAQALVNTYSIRIEALTSELANIRRFTMTAVDNVRGETRAWQERCADIEKRLAKEKQHLEIYRRLAYSRGAQIPPDLQGESNP